MALGIASAGGSFGQIAIVPLAQGLITYESLEFSILAMAALAFVLMPLAIPMVGKPSEAAAVAAPGPAQALSDVLKGAVGNSGFILLTLGFFTCGFQVAFIGVHLPVYLLNCGLPIHIDIPTLAATALATVGIFNMIGTYFQGCWYRGSMKNLSPGITLCAASLFLPSSWHPSRSSPSWRSRSRWERCGSGLYH